MFTLLGAHAGGHPASADPICGNTGSPAGPFDFETYEAAQWRETYHRLFELAGHNRLFPELPAFTLPRLETGGRAAGSGQLTDPYIPPKLLKAIAWIESSWSHADWTVPYGGVGPVKMSSSCAYGIMQVLSGMQNTTGVPNLNQAMIGGHYAFNIARGAQILADKWNYAPEFRPIVGKRNPKIVEDWYYAVWSYHGFAFRNHPRNPDYSSSRPAYRCDGTQPYSNYPYQELVFGCLRNPPVVGGERLWNPLPVTLPKRSNPAFNLSNWNACSVNGNCANMDIATPLPRHKDAASTSLTRSQVIGSPKISTSSGSIELSATHGGKSLSTSFSVRNTGSGVLAVRVTPSKAWLKVSRYQGIALGSDLGTRKLKLSVRGVATEIPAGTHTATIKVKSLYPSKTTTINVTFRVFGLPDGTVIENAGSKYVMRGGLRHLIPNQLTFEANGFDPASVTKVPSTLLPTIPAGQPLLDARADGNLLRGSGPTVYVMESGGRRGIASLDAFEACGYGWDAVRRVSDARLEAIPKGPRLQGQPCPHLSPPDGTLITDSGPKVYVMRKGLKRHIPNLITLESDGLVWGDRNRIADSALAAIPTGDPLVDALADGNLLRGSGNAVYVMDGGLKRHVVGLEVMDACGYAFGAVRSVSSGRLNAVAEGARLSEPPCPQLTPPGGTLVQGSGGPVYVMRNGLRRHVPNLVTFDAEDLHWGNVNLIHNSHLAAIPTGDPLLNALADGNLLRGSVGAVYVMDGGLKRHVSSPSVMVVCGYTFGAVRTVSDGQLNAIAEGPGLTAPPCPHLTPPGGTLVQGSGGTVYVMRDGLKRHISNLVTFDAEDLHWGNVNLIHNSHLAAIPTGDPLLNALADGNLLRGSVGAVYVMDGGLKRHVASPSVMVVCGYTFGAVRTVSDGQLNAMGDGPSLTGPPCPQMSPPDGTLLKASDGKVYVMDEGLKRRVAGDETFATCGYLDGNVNRVPNSTIDAIPDGEDVTAPPCP